ncbi:MAG: peptide chain release factor 2, partial [Chloroflexota bacterium]
LDIAGKASKLADLEQQAAAPDLWNDPDSAQQLMQELSRVKREVERWRGHASQINDALELAEMDDADLLEELTSEHSRLAVKTEKMELAVVFSGPYDDEPAILSIHAGAGGTDAQDWAQMMERMYTRWAEANGYKYETLDRSDGEEAGIKNVTISISGGDYPYGYLQSEQGVHRLVRISPFNSNGKRQTSFAKIELYPDIQDDIEIEVDPNDLRIDTFRAGGAGGQHVQKNDTAVRITHNPTGIVVSCQNQRSQTQNRERAMQILKSRLFEMERRKQEAELAQLKGENVDAGWGNQIRSYVLHPYQMVKDLRTSYEMGNTDAVLDGDLNGFMESYLRAQLEKLST